MPDAAPLLEATDITCRYGTIEAVHGVSLGVSRGEIVALIGPNGAGKSTLIRALAGLQRPSSGRIALFGQDVTRLSGPARVELGLALVPEGRGVLPTLSVHDNLRMGAYTRRHEPWVTEQLRFVLDLFPVLAERRQQAAGTLSGGEQQMLVIGRALMSRPQLIMLDEPSFGLAPKIVSRVFDVIQELRRLGTTFLLVEQNAHMALGIADRGYVLESGFCILTDTAARLRDNPIVKDIYLGTG